MSDNSFKIKNSAVITPKDLATIANPEAGEIACDINDANKIKRYNTDAAAWVELGSGGGLLNYIDNDDFEAGPTGYATYLDAAGESPVDGTGGTANVTITATTTTPLRGTKSGLITKDAANRQGQGVSYGFSIDPADQAKVLRVSFDYSSSPNYVDGDIRVYVFDVTNSRMIEVVDRDLQASAQGRFVGTFQSSANSTSYRLIFHVASISALAYTVEIDSVFVGEQNIVRGPIVTDWIAYTPIVTNLGTGSTSILEGRYRRNGDSIDIHIRGRKDTSDGTGSVAVQFSLPSGLSVDYNKIPNSSGVLGSFWSSGMTTLTGLTTSVSTSFPNVITILDQSASPYVLTGSDFLANAYFNFDLKGLPIQGWSSNVVLSEDAGNREVVGVLYKPEAQSIPGNSVLTNVTFTSTHKITDTTNSFSDANDGFIIPETGFYDLFAQSRIASNTDGWREIRILVDGAGLLEGSSLTSSPALTASTNLFCSAIASYLTKGQIVTYQVRQSSGVSLNATENKLIIAKRSSPQTIAASEVVACRYTSNAGQSIPNSTGTTLLFEDKEYDTHNSYNTTTGIFTAPQTGYYLINCNIQFSGLTAGTGLIRFYSILSSGTNVQGDYQDIEGAGQSACINKVIYLSKDQTISIAVFQNNGASRSIVNISDRNSIEITKLNGVS